MIETEKSIYLTIETIVSSPATHALNEQKKGCLGKLINFLMFGPDRNNLAQL